MSRGGDSATPARGRWRLSVELGVRIRPRSARRVGWSKKNNARHCQSGEGKRTEARDDRVRQGGR